MSETRASKSKRKRGPATAGNASLSLNKRVVGIIAVVALAMAGWIAGGSWQRALALDTDPLGAPLAVTASDTSTRAPNAKPSDAVGTQTGEIAPDFSVPTLDGGTFSLTAQRGKPAIIFFMAYWCYPCIAEARVLSQLKREYREQLSIVAIDLDRSSTPEALSRFKRVADNGAYTWAFDGDQKVARAYRVWALDTTLVLDAKGRITHRDAHPTPYQTLKEVLVELGL